MDWGALGAALQTFGGGMSKKLMEDNLRKAREAREDQLYERRMGEYARTEYVEKNVGGETVLYEVTRDRNNRVIDEKLAPHNKVEELRAEREKVGLAKRLQEAQIGKLERDAALAEILNPIKVEEARAKVGYAEAGTRQRDAAAAASLARAAGGSRSVYSAGEEPSEEEVVSLLMKENKSIMDSLVKKYPEHVKATDLSAMTRRAVKDAYSRGLNPNSYLLEIFKAYEARLANKPKTIKR